MVNHCDDLTDPDSPVGNQHGYADRISNHCMPSLFKIVMILKAVAVGLAGSGQERSLEALSRISKFRCK
jgi:hypothetical protein